MEVGKMSKKARLKKLLDYVTYNTEEKCSEKSGFYRILNIPITLNADVQKLLLKLRNIYKESLQFFHKVVDYLMKNREINIAQLNLLSKKTRDILAQLYTMCELYYLIIISISLEQNNELINQ
jgi:tRNA isopentenyl-2-thiomethyl-A-37 hydroxylase MiaE